MSKGSGGVLEIIFDLYDERRKAESLRGTSKGERTVKFTVVSIFQSLFMLGCIILTVLCIRQIEGLNLFLMFFPILLCGFSAIIFMLHALNNISCQKKVNGKGCRFIALIVFFICLIVGCYFAYFFLQL